MPKPKILCPACSTEINPGDKFCTSCGAAIEWGETPEQADATSRAVPDGPPQKCPLCGYENPGGMATCGSCGAALPGASHATPAAARAATPKAVPPSQGLDSWKIVAGVAVVIVLILVGVEFFRSAKPPQGGGMPQQGSNPASRMDDPERQQNLAALAKQIDAQQKIVNENPNDAGATLHLANMLQDAKVPDRAIEVYKKYLAMKPEDANATVDMGVCYYELASADSVNAMDDLKAAQSTFMHALSLQPRHQLAHFNLGIVSLMSGDMHSAGEWFRKCAEIDTTTDVGRRAQTLLTQHSMNSKP